MQHTSPIYPGNYEIKLLGKTKYIHCANPNTNVYQFNCRSDSRELIASLIDLDLENESKIIDFLNSKGLLINTQKNSEHLTYFGIPVSGKLNHLISPFDTGVSMPLPVFYQQIELIKNISLLSTEIALYKPAYKETTSLKATKNIKYINHAKEKLNIIQHLFNVLYQPCMTNESLHNNTNWLIGGNTALSRFSVNFHDLLLSIPKPTFSSDYISNFNLGVLNLGKKNISIKENINLNKPLYITDILPKYENKLFIATRYFEIEKCNKEIYTIVPEQLTLDSMEYINLLKLLITLEKYFKISYQKNNEIIINYLDSYNPICPESIMSEVCLWGKQIIIEYINAHTSNINYELCINESQKYTLQLISESLSQSLFLEMANILNYYNITICKYPGCKKPVFSTRKRPAKCCSPNHLKCYKGLFERESKKLLRL